MRFSILIPTWNNLELLKLCVRSIRTHSAYKHEIIVHVNEGLDGTTKWLKEEGIAHTHSKENIGICHAMNQIAAKANHDILCYINDDMYVLPGWDLMLIKTLELINGRDEHSHSKKLELKKESQEFMLANEFPEHYTKEFMLSATMIEPRETNNPSCIVSDYGDSIGNFQEEQLLNDYASLPFKNYWKGATWPPLIMHKDLWNQVGGFSEEFSPGMYSDPDLSMKLWQAGVRWFIGVGDARVYHFMSKSTGKVVRNDGRAQFLKKWGVASSTFTNHFLKRGSEMKSPNTLDEPSGVRYWLARLMDKLK